jgi:hypothetical protein
MKACISATTCVEALLLYPRLQRRAIVAHVIEAHRDRAQIVRTLLATSATTTTAATTTAAPAAFSSKRAIATTIAIDELE